MARVSGWGRYPVIDVPVDRPVDVAGAARVVAHHADVIVRGNGRSYGDAALNRNAVVDATRLDRLLAFDPESGRLVCEAGVLLADLIDVMLPRGWWPVVTPGTRLVTVGGMIASDVHGKNHHGAGSFCDHLDWLDLSIGDGQVLRCSRVEHADLFAATCGGMGLTGAILRAGFRLMPVETARVRQRTRHAPDLRRAIEIFETTLDHTYSVAWIDCLASGRQLGRSAVLLGDHARHDDLTPAARRQPFARPARRARRVPIDLPGFVLSRASVSLFNRLYYHAQRPGDALVAADPFFYPLDTLRDWNRIYGRAGFVQYQCVLPLAASEAGFSLMLSAIAAEGRASFLAVLKRLGGQSFGMLSFPQKGYTLALDFPVTAANLRLLDRLDAITRDHGGRVYLAKDARAAAATIAAGYPRLAEFRAVRAAYGLDSRFSSLLSQRLDL